MMVDRDPTLDPQKGDIVRGKGGRMRCVMRRQGGNVYYQKSPKDSVLERLCWITTWQEWCRQGEVIWKGGIE